MQVFYILVAALVAACVSAEASVDAAVDVPLPPGTFTGGVDVELGSGDEEVAIKKLDSDSEGKTGKSATLVVSAKLVPVTADNKLAKAAKSAKSATSVKSSSSVSAKSAKTAKSKSAKSVKSAKGVKTKKATAKFVSASQKATRHTVTAAAVTALVALAVFAGVLWKARFQEGHWSVEVEEDANLLSDTKPSYA